MHCKGRLKVVFCTAFIDSYRFLYIDVKKDKRYSEWGIHPVDIRSKLTKEKRPLDGAKLGIEDSRKLKRLTKTEFLLDHKRFSTYSEAINFLGNNELNEFNSILLDLHIENIDYLRSIFRKFLQVSRILHCRPLQYKDKFKVHDGKNKHSKFQ